MDWPPELIEALQHLPDVGVNLAASEIRAVLDAAVAYRDEHGTPAVVRLEGHALTWQNLADSMLAHAIARAEAAERDAQHEHKHAMRHLRERDELWESLYWIYKCIEELTSDDYEPGTIYWARDRLEEMERALKIRPGGV